MPGFIPHANTEEQFVDQRFFNADELRSRGWVSFVFPSSEESELREQLLAFARVFGKPAVTRFDGGLCDTLLPMESDAAKPRSLSKLYAVGEFPLHNDTAHWLTPCRYIVLACISPGSAARPTLLMDVRRVPLNEHQHLLLHSAPLRVVNGRYSFFSTIFSKGRPFVRLDRGCMAATTSEGATALAILTQENWPGYVESVHWKVGMVLVLDNWRMLHGRGHAHRSDHDRKLLRISIR